ncbi:MAG: prepilin-type N-terminal cleavage/methylation domain-containing protein [Nitrospirae bacterium]|nr:prepilin-type N-terminal cleavage/methylation domain-containing protein [Nitrospirota bacterium]
MKNKGFTLVETIMTIVIVFIVGYIVADAVTKGMKTYLVTDQRKEALDEARTAIERMTREMRNLIAVNSISATELCFTNIDGTKISFRQSGGSIIRNTGWTSCPPTTGGTDNTLSTNITELSFALIQNSLTVNLTSTFQGESVPLQSEVYLRNR